MFRWFVFCVILCGAAYWGVAWLSGADWRNPTKVLDSASNSEKADTTKDEKDRAHRVGLEAIVLGELADGRFEVRPVVVNSARIVILERQEVSSDKEGQIVFVGTDLKPGEEKTLPPDRIIIAEHYYMALEVAYENSPNSGALSFPLAGDPLQGKLLKIPFKDCFTFEANGKVYTRWKEGMPVYAKRAEIKSEPRKYRKLEAGEEVVPGQLLALVDPKISLIDLRIKLRSLDAAEADRFASEKTRDESKTRFDTLVKLEAQRAASQEDMRGAELTWHRYLQEEIAKAENARKSAFEVVAAMEVMRLHEVRAAVKGRIKTIYRQKGDGVKPQSDPIMQIQNPAQLYADGQVDVQQSRDLDEGDVAALEISQPVQPRLDLKGHLQQVTAVAVSKGTQRRIVFAAGEDRTLRGWDANTGAEVFRIQVPSAIRALAYTGKGAKSDLLLAGFADGTVCLYDFADPKGAHPVELSKEHTGAVLCVAFSADGTLCATAGEDHSIVLWSVADHKKLDVKTNAHRSDITSLAFQGSRLISAGRDMVLQVWEANNDKPLARLGDPFEKRSGDINTLGAFGDRVLFDAGKELRVLTLKDRQIEGVLRNPSGSSPFTTLAQFSPDGKTILTNGTVDGRLQLWRAPPRYEAGETRDPSRDGRGSELRHFVYQNAVATCAAFDPDGSFAVTGMQDGHVLVWTMPSTEEVEQRVPATIWQVEGDLQGNASQVRVLVKLEQHPKWLLPGSTATIVVLPKAKAK